MSIQIRDAIPSDAKSMADGQKQIAHTPGFMVSTPAEISVDQIQLQIKKTDAKCIVALKDGEVVGHAILEPMHLEGIRHVARLTIMVHLGHEEMGLGETMLRHLIEWAKGSLHVEKIELNVRGTNLRAIRLYQKLGFNLEGRLRNRVKTSQGFIDDLVMGLFVKDAPSALSVSMLPIGIVRSARKVAIDDNWDAVASAIELDPTQFDSEALMGLETFSHAEIIFQMNQVDVRKIESGSRHPRNRTDWPKIGIFAQRGKNRPNQIGSTICRILKVDGLRLELEGLDAIDGTPVLDIKPFVQEFGPRGQIKQPEWMGELMTNYWKEP